MIIKISKRDTRKIPNLKQLTCLSKYEIVRTKQLSKWTCSHCIHCTWLEIHEDCSRNVSTTSCFVEVNIDTFKLKIRIAVISSYQLKSKPTSNLFVRLRQTNEYRQQLPMEFRLICWIYAVLIGHDLGVLNQNVK